MCLPFYWRKRNPHCQLYVVKWNFICARDSKSRISNSFRYRFFWIFHSIYSQNLLPVNFALYLLENFSEWNLISLTRICTFICKTFVRCSFICRISDLHCAQSRSFSLQWVVFVMRRRFCNRTLFVSHNKSPKQHRPLISSWNRIMQKFWVLSNFCHENTIAIARPSSVFAIWSRLTQTFEHLIATHSPEGPRILHSRTITHDSNMYGRSESEMGREEIR